MRKKLKWFLIYSGVFLLAFSGSVAFKLLHDPLAKLTAADPNKVGKKYSDLSYGPKQSNKFDLYLPAGKKKKSYGLVVYLHAGGFTSGDKSDDTRMLEWLCSKGYVAAGINYTLRTEKDPTANIATQAQEIKESMPLVIAKAKEMGYNIDQMAVSGGSAGGYLALVYAYRDAKTAPVPVKLVFEGVGPSSFYPSDWSIYGLDKDKKAAASFFSMMTGKKITADMFGTAEYDKVVKDVSPLLLVDKDTPPTVMAYGKYDKVQPYPASKRLARNLEKYHIPHEYIVFEHSGHGLQNDTARSRLYIDKINEYLAKYLPVE